MENMSVPVYTFRFDDISLNTDPNRVLAMMDIIRTCAGPGAQFIMAVSPAVHYTGHGDLVRERVFPSIFHTESDYRVFYRPERIGIPNFLAELRKSGSITIAGHGLIHVDHRLLPKAVQELSIIMSCALLETSMFVPPFHKWNKDTEEICRDHRIDLVKYDSDWKHLKYTKFNPTVASKYYFHTHDFTIEEFNNQFPRTVN